MTYPALLGLEEAEKLARVLHALAVHLHLLVADWRFSQCGHLCSGELLVVDKVHVRHAGTRPVVRIPSVGSLAQHFGVGWLLVLNAAVELLDGVRIGRHELEAPLLISECAFLHRTFKPVILVVSGNRDTFANK